MTAAIIIEATHILVQQKVWNVALIRVTQRNLRR